MKTSPLLAMATPVGEVEAVRLPHAALADARLAELQQHAAVGRKLRHLQALAVFRAGIGDPEIAVMIDGGLMRLDEQAGAEILQRLAVGTDFEHAFAVVGLAAVHPPRKLFLSSTVMALTGFQPRDICAQFVTRWYGLGRSFAQG
jgi:hypothetical protein